MDWILQPEAWVALVTLTVLEVVLGIDNVIFISILAGRLPAQQQGRARRLGLGLAMITRILLLAFIAWIARLTTPLFSLLGHGVSGRDLILMGGGLFLLAKATYEIHGHLEGVEGRAGSTVKGAFVRVIVQIMLLDIVFSLDSVITAVGMARRLPVMITAVIIAVLIMMWSAGPIGDFVHRHPTIKMLALSFLLLIGVSLMAEGLGQHISKGYIYCACAFSVFVEMLNLRLRARAAPMHLREAYVNQAEGEA